MNNNRCELRQSLEFCVFSVTLLAITFDRPGENFVTVELKIENVSNRCVHFKVKTTAPKRYCVRPNGGFIKVGETSTVLIILQKVAPEVALTNPKKDKFLVQTCLAPASEDPKTLWNNIPKEEVCEHKLRCLWNIENTHTVPSEEVSTATFETASVANNAGPGSQIPSRPSMTEEDESALAAASHIQQFKEENAQLTKINNGLRKDLDALKRGSTNAMIATDYKGSSRSGQTQTKNINSMYVMRGETRVKCIQTMSDFTEHHATVSRASREGGPSYLPKMTIPDQLQKHDYKVSEEVVSLVPHKQHVPEADVDFHHESFEDQFTSAPHTVNQYILKRLRSESNGMEPCPEGVDAWEFSGNGLQSNIKSIIRTRVGSNDNGIEDVELTPLLKESSYELPHKQLGVLVATAICGNDISSSCLYVAGIAAYYAGRWAPLALCIVAVLLYLFRSIYVEVVTALPVNGGTYTALLNTTTKQVASIAACLTLLSYVSTAVVSAATASAYAHSILPWLGVEWMTVCILALFAFLNLMGISESGPVAVVFFIMHIATLSLLLCNCAWFVYNDNFALLKENWHADLSEIPGANANGFVLAVYYGFCAGLLGISGFETSANFVEEQKPGVFAKTLRNMWALTALYNPLISLFSISVLPISTAMGLPLVDERPNNEDLLINMAQNPYLKTLIGIDAVLVLSGAVLTSYVGVTGLMRRMALDRCLPNFFLSENRLRGTKHNIILTFFFICTSLYYVMNFNTVVLASIYTLSFLSVMFLFGAGNLLLKWKRHKIVRKVRASVITVLIAMCAVVAGLIGNIMQNIKYVKWFSLYLFVCLIVVETMLYRDLILKLAMSRLVHIRHEKFYFLGYKPTEHLMDLVAKYSVRIKSQRMIFFVKDQSIVVLNKACLYVRGNEQTNWLQFVHVYQDEAHIERIARDIRTLDSIYPKMRFDFIAIKGTFDRQEIDMISDYLRVPKHFMFIACPGITFKQDIAKLGGVRIITI
eukprot:CFRG5518T1